MRPTGQIGFGIILIKIGPKLLPLLLKLKDALINLLAPTAAIKGAGIAGSVVLYSYLFTWEMGLALVVFIGIHEYGHLWAMKKCGIKTKGMFFIPGFGAVAVAEERFGSARNEAYVAIMGPVFGLVMFSFPALIAYLYTGNPFWAVAASVTTFINLINLLPINPLDGGRILKAVAYSSNLGASFTTTVVIMGISAYFAISKGFWLIAYLGAIGFVEILSEFGIKKYIEALIKVFFRALKIFLLWYISSMMIEFYGNEPWEMIFWSFGFWFALLLCLLCIVFLCFDACSITWDRKRGGRPLWFYPVAVIENLIDSFQELKNLKSKKLEPIENYPVMAQSLRLFYAAAFAGLVLLHMFILLGLGKLSIPETSFVNELLR